MHEKVIEFIRTIRESFIGSSTVYTRGSCFQFYRILKLVFPEAEAYYDMNHVITKIGVHYYDINGLAKKEHHIHWDEIKTDSKVDTCKFNIFDMWYKTTCPSCEEEFIIDHETHN